jgi:hypothetical protein
MRQLKEPIDYRVELMHLAINAQLVYEQVGMMVHVVRAVRTFELPNAGFEMIAVSPKDEYNYNRLMGKRESELVGVGRLVEKVSTEWLVAWRPFSPAPQLRSDE